jgi:hypothetical protein
MSKKKIPTTENTEISKREEAERLKTQLGFQKLRGKVKWEGDLEEMRTDSQQLQDWCDSSYQKKD